jgi:hypothetical protein
VPPPSNESPVRSNGLSILHWLRGERFSPTRVYTSSPSIVNSVPIGAAGDHLFACAANLCSHLLIVECDFSSALPVALTPIPSVLIFIASDTNISGVLNLAIAVPVRSLNL